MRFLPTIITFLYYRLDLFKIKYAIRATTIIAIEFFRLKLRFGSIKYLDIASLSKLRSIFANISPSFKRFILR